MFTLYVYTNRIKHLHCMYILTASNVCIACIYYPYQKFTLYVYTNRIKHLHSMYILTVSNVYIVCIYICTKRIKLSNCMYIITI